MKGTGSSGVTEEKRQSFVRLNKLTPKSSRGNLPELMKYIPVVSAAAALALAACESMNAPLTTSGDFDPLAPAGGVVKSGGSTSTATFKPGQFVTALIDNTAFFLKRPKGDADADKLLPRNTQMKVISADSSYVKVELDSGEVGFVPAVMVNDPNAPVPVDSTGGLYMPLPESGPVEPLPNLVPSNMPPDGIPPIIDPSIPPPSDPGAAPVPTPPAPPADGTTPAPAPAPAPVPLPPGIDDAPAKAEEKKPAQ